MRRALALLVLSLLAAPAAAAAAQLEKLLMPGPLAKAHEKLEDDCGQCHGSRKEPEKAKCLACHETVAKDVRAKQGFHGRAPAVAAQDCRQCHSDHKGRAADIVGLTPALFDHQHTDFALKGAHRALPCGGCHVKDRPYRDTAGACLACHKDDDVHRGQMGKQCESCHSAESWRSSAFNHDKTRFPLKDSHRDVACASCHADSTFKNTPTACVSCHKLDDRHGGLFGTDCASCHGAKKWSVARFDHGRATTFPLEGRHRDADCHGCHTEATRGRKLKTACASCHGASDFHQGRFGQDCAGCHSPAGWKKDSFKHGKETGFALQGRHETLGCDSCHAAPRAKSAGARVCVDCHRAGDPHRGQQGDRCETCHQQTSWTARLRFDHDLTRFPLIGAHAMTACSECHLNQAYAATDSACGACHRADDAHKGAMGPACDCCHTPAGWGYHAFNHDKDTGYPLTGGHAKAACEACHREPVRQAREVAIDRRCNSCHVTDDPHRGGFGTNCEQCHTTKSFTDVQVQRGRKAPARSP